MTDLTADIDAPLPVDPDNGRDAAVNVAPSEETALLSGGPRRRRSNSYSLVDISRWHFYLIMTLIGSELFLISFDSTIISSSHPVITSHFHASHLAPWLSTGFLLANIAMNPAIAALVEPLGRRNLMLGGGLVLLASMAWCACATSMVSLILARAVTGGALSVWAIVGNLMISDLVAVEQRGTWQGMTNLAWGTGAASGAALGGLLADLLGWRWLFGIQVPVVALLILGFLAAIPGHLGDLEQNPNKKTIREAMQSFDSAGCLLLSTSATCLVLLASIGGNVVPWSHPLIIVSALVSVTTGVLFIRAERRAINPVYPLNLMVHAPFGSLYGSQILYASLTNGLFFNIPLYFQAVLLDTPTTSGIRLVAPMLANAVFGIASSILVRFTGHMTPFIRIGSACMCATALAVCFYSPAWPEWAYWASVTPIGVANGLFYPSTSIACVAHTEQRHQAAAAGLVHITRVLGAVVGLAAFGLVMQNSLIYHLEENVTGPDRDNVISGARKSVEVIHELPQPYLGQVIESYRESLHTTFVAIFVVSLLVVPLVVFMRLMRIQVAAK